MLTPVGEHELLLFWLQLVVLLAAARGLGALMQRVGQPAVVGELGAGLLLGPSVLGRSAPGVAGWLFPGGEVESALLLSVAWLGIVLLLVVTGFETDLGLITRLGRSSAAVSVGSLIVPLALGFSLGLLLPDLYIGEAGTRLTFALFLAVALSISALPVVAKILADMRLMRRDFGQITLAAGMVNDLVGWLLLGMLIRIVHVGGFEVARLGLTLAAITAFVAAALTVGQRGVDEALRRARKSREGGGAVLSVTVLVALVAGAVTHLIGMEAVIGAFVAGIVLGRSRYLPDDARHALERMSNAVFAPIFFATAGLYVDLGTLFSADSALAAAAVLAVAVVAKLGGSYIGGRLSRMSPLESLAVGAGLNARGAMEIVLAAIGLRLAVLNEASYTAIVLMAMATSLLAPPMLRPILRRLTARPEEAERLQQEELLAGSVIAKTTSALLPTRGGANSLAAARMLDLVLQPGATVTVLTVHRPGDPDLEGSAARARFVAEGFGGRRVEWRREVAGDPVGAILTEAGLGYQLTALGVNEEFRGTHQLSRRLQRLLAETATPVLLVRRAATNGRPVQVGSPRRLLVPVTGTATGRAAEEVAYVIAARTGADVDAVHVLSREGHATDRPIPPIVRQLRRTRTLAARFGGTVSPQLRVGAVAYEELLTAADERGTDLIVLGAQVRAHDGRPFLGHGTEHILERARQAVAVVVFPG